MKHISGPLARRVPSGDYVFTVTCRQQTAPATYLWHEEQIVAPSGPEALKIARDMFVGQLKRETDLFTNGPMGGEFHLKVTLTEIKQAREPKPEQLKLPM